MHRLLFYPYTLDMHGQNTRILLTHPAENEIARHLEVELVWLIQHAWKRGESLQQAETGATSIWLVEKGEIEVSSPDRSWRVTAGELFLWPAGQPRHIVCRQDASWTTLGLRAGLFGRVDLFSLLHLPRLQALTDTEKNRWDALMDSLREANSDTAVDAVLRIGVCQAVTGLCWKTFADTDLSSALQEAMPGWLQKTLHYAAGHPLATVSDLGQEAGFSPAQFRRGFARWMNVSPRDYLQRQRLEAARQELLYTDLPVQEIAERNGFATATHFNRQWKKAYGSSPGRWREINRQPQAPA